jgi:hypothetical protein
MSPRFRDLLDKEIKKQLGSIKKPTDQPTEKKPKRQRSKPEHLSERDVLQLMSARSYVRGRGGAIRQRRY